MTSGDSNARARFFLAAPRPCFTASRHQTQMLKHLFATLEWCLFSVKLSSSSSDLQLRYRRYSHRRRSASQFVPTAGISATTRAAAGCDPDLRSEWLTSSIVPLVRVKLENWSCVRALLGGRCSGISTILRRPSRLGEICGCTLAMLLPTMLKETFTL